MIQQQFLFLKYQEEKGKLSRECLAETPEYPEEYHLCLQSNPRELPIRDENGKS